MFGMKRRRVTSEILARLEPELKGIEKIIGPLPTALFADLYLLGYTIGQISILIQLITGGHISVVEKGRVLYSVIDSLYGTRAPSHELLASLLDGSINDEDFVRGVNAAKKFMYTLHALPDFESDSDVITAREEASVTGHALDFLDPIGTESSKVAGHLHYKFFNQYIIARYGRL